MESEIYQRVQPRDFHARFLSQGVRSDGRQVAERRARRTSQNHFARSHGSASVRCGGGFYIAAVRGEIGRQMGDAHSEGDAKQPRIIVTVEMPKMCGMEFDDPSSGGYHSNFPLVLSGTLTEIVNSSAVIDATQFQINKKSCWVLHVSVTCLQYDGGLFDMCLAAVVAALEDTVLPAVEWDDAAAWWRVVSTSGNKEGASMVDDEHAANDNDNKFSLPAVGVRLNSRPSAVTFAFLVDEFWIVDPSKGEERVGAMVIFCRVDGAKGSENALAVGGEGCDRMLGRAIERTNGLGRLMVLHPGGVSQLNEAVLQALRRSADDLLSDSGVNDAPQRGGRQKCETGSCDLS